MLFEMVPMLVRRFDRNDPDDTDLETEAGVPLPFGLRQLYIETENATFMYGQEEVSREWVVEWINRDPQCAFWIVVDGKVYAASSVSYNGNIKKSSIDTPLKFYYRLRATMVYIEDRTTLEHKPTRYEVIPPFEDDDENLAEATAVDDIVRTVKYGFGNNTRFEACEIVNTTLCMQPGFRGIHIINEAHAENLMRLTEVLPPDTKRMREVELLEGVRHRLAQDLKTREALPLDLDEERIEEWRTLLDVADDVDWHMHIR